MRRFLILISTCLVMVSLGVDVNVALAQAQKPKKDLNQASVDGELDRVKELVSGGADVNSKNRMGMTPLVVAAMNNRTAVCEFLVDNGADLNAQDGQGRTALYFAVNRGNKELIELLVKKGADVNVTTGRGENAFSLAKKKGNAEIVDLLAKNGGTDPVVQLGYEDEYYGAGDGMAPGRPGAAPGQAGPIRGVATAAAPEVDLLADPNEITARLKTFEGLEKTIVGLAKNSATEMKYWAQTRYDNRSSVARAVQKQVEDELAVVKKIAVEEKAKKTIEAIDALVKQKQERYRKVSRELMQQRREAQGQSSRSGGRARSSGRSRGGRSSAQWQASAGAAAGGGYEDAYGYGAGSQARGGRPARPGEELDRDTQDEIRQWTQATIDNKADLAKAVYPQIHDEFAVIRQLAANEQAKKTTAAIDGILLARQVRLDVYVKAADALRAAGAEGQNQGTAGRYGDQTTRATGGRRGRTTRGGTTQQQNTQRGGRTRRR